MRFERTSTIGPFSIPEFVILQVLVLITTIGDNELGFPVGVLITVPVAIPTAWILRRRRQRAEHPDDMNDSLEEHDEGM
jgi:hypothetical protein